MTVSYLMFSYSDLVFYESRKTFFFYIEDILEAASDIHVDSICSFCSRMKRGRIYHAARREKFNVLAMGQHLDDLSERFVLYFAVMETTSKI